MMNDNHPLVSIQIVVHNGRSFLSRCLDAVRAQTYPSIEILVLDNASSDGTPDIVSQRYPECVLIRGGHNIGMWPGQEMLLHRSRGTYILALSVDVILDPRFLERAVIACERDTTIAAVQSKMYQYDASTFRGDDSLPEKKLIDTCGFAITRSRRVVNIGHGEPDDGRFDAPTTIFGVEGAAPLFRRSAIESCRVDGRLIDPDYFWYGDDLDLAWRMTLFGHRQVFLPDVIAWHDRSTTKGAAVSFGGHLRRLKIRRSIPLRKRRLDWSNVRFTIIKNDYILNLLADAPWFCAREIATLLYTIVFEPEVLAEVGRFIRLLPRMIRRRHAVMRLAVIPPHVMHQWFT